MPNLNRRAALIGAALSSIAVAVAAVPAIANPDAKLLALAADWVAANENWNAAAAPHADEVAYDMCDEPQEAIVSALEHQINATKPATSMGLVVKMLIVTGFGDFFPSDDLVTEAMELTGFLPHTMHPRHPSYVRSAHVIEPAPQAPSDSGAEIMARIAELSPDEKRQYAATLRSQDPVFGEFADRIEAWANRT
ncbi:MAG: hypothetical protein ABIQ30_08015 [Devosia sp.]